MTAALTSRQRGLEPLDQSRVLAIPQPSGPLLPDPQRTGGYAVWEIRLAAGGRR